jgi:hypothetical protein
MMDAGFRILTPLGTRIDLEKVNADLDALFCVQTRRHRSVMRLGACAERRCRLPTLHD